MEDDVHSVGAGSADALDIREQPGRVSLLCGGLWVGGAALGVMLAVSVAFASWWLILLVSLSLKCELFLVFLDDGSL